MSITAENRAEVQSAYGHCCGYCGVSEIDIGGELQIDHYRPTTKGGSDDLDNLVYTYIESPVVPWPHRIRALDRLMSENGSAPRALWSG